MEPPPSRYQVIEKDGRLIVLDRGEPIETLVKHDHPVSSSVSRRRSGRPSATPARRAAGASSPGTTLGSEAFPKLFGSAAIVLVMVILFWPFLLPIAVIGIFAMSFFGSKEDPAWRRLLRAYMRWLRSD